MSVRTCEFQDSNDLALSARCIVGSYRPLLTWLDSLCTSSCLCVRVCVSAFFCLQVWECVGGCVVAWPQPFIPIVPSAPLLLRHPDCCGVYRCVCVFPRPCHSQEVNTADTRLHSGTALTLQKGCISATTAGSYCAIHHIKRPLCCYYHTVWCS